MFISILFSLETKSVVFLSPNWATDFCWIHLPWITYILTKPLKSITCTIKLIRDPYFFTVAAFNCFGYFDRFSVSVLGANLNFSNRKRISVLHNVRCPVQALPSHYRIHLPGILLFIFINHKKYLVQKFAQFGITIKVIIKMSAQNIGVSDLPREESLICLLVRAQTRAMVQNRAILRER